MVKNKDMQFFMEDLKMERKKDKIFLTFWRGNLKPRFSVIFPPMIWIFMWCVEPEIKSKQASKRDARKNINFWREKRWWKSKLLCLGLKSTPLFVFPTRSRGISNHHKPILTSVGDYRLVSLVYDRNQVLVLETQFRYRNQFLFSETETFFFFKFQIFLMFFSIYWRDTSFFNFKNRPLKII